MSNKTIRYAVEVVIVLALALAIWWLGIRDVYGQPQDMRVFLTEIAPLGTISAHGGEWFEISNEESVDVSLEGWRLVIWQSPTVTNTIVIPPVTIIPGGVALFERTDGDVTNQQEDGIFTGAIPNIAEQVALFNADGLAVQTLHMPDGWPIVNTGMKPSIAVEWGADPQVLANWYESNMPYNGALDEGGVFIFGSPGDVNPPQSTLETCVGGWPLVVQEPVLEFSPERELFIYITTTLQKDDGSTLPSVWMQVRWASDIGFYVNSTDVEDLSVASEACRIAFDRTVFAALHALNDQHDDLLPFVLARQWLLGMGYWSNQLGGFHTFMPVVKGD